MKIINVDDMKAAARRHLPRVVFDFIEGGVDDEIGLTRLRSAFDALSLVPRVGRDVSSVSIETRLFGRSLPAPFGIAPTGLANLYRPGTDVALARSAAARGIPYILSAASSSSMEALAPLLGGLCGARSTEPETGRSWMTWSDAQRRSILTRSC